MRLLGKRLRTTRLIPFSTWPPDSTHGLTGCRYPPRFIGLRSICPRSSLRKKRNWSTNNQGVASNESSWTWRTLTRGEHFFLVSYKRPGRFLLLPRGYSSI